MPNIQFTLHLIKNAIKNEIDDKKISGIYTFPLFFLRLHREIYRQVVCLEVRNVLQQDRLLGK